MSFNTLVQINFANNGPRLEPVGNYDYALEELFTKLNKNVVIDALLNGNLFLDSDFCSTAKERKATEKQI